MFVSIDLLGPKEVILLLPQWLPKTFWTLIYCSLRCVILDYSRKIGEIFFPPENVAFFSKICVFNNELVLQKWYFYLYIIIRKPIGPLQIVPIVVRSLSHSIIREEIGQNPFFSGKVAFFSKICVSNKHLCLQKNALKSSTVIVKISCEPS